MTRKLTVSPTLKSTPARALIGVGISRTPSELTSTSAGKSRRIAAATCVVASRVACAPSRSNAAAVQYDEPPRVLPHREEHLVGAVAPRLEVTLEHRGHRAGDVTLVGSEAHRARPASIEAW